jgi:hypothetical protein
MSNDPRPVAKPPLPVLKRSKSGTVPVTRRDPESGGGGRKPSETGRSGSMPAVRSKNVLRRLDPAFTPDDRSKAWEPRGTTLGGSYRESLPTVPSPEVLEARLLAELTEAKPQPASTEVKPLEVAGARAQFEPAHAPAVRVSPIMELEKAVPVIVDPLAIASVMPEDSEPLEDYPSASALLLASPGPVAPPDLAAPQIEADVMLEQPPGDSESEREPSARSRITLPPARRRRRRSRRALLFGIVMLGAIAGAGWYRYPAQCEQGWQRARAELGVGWHVLEQQWLAARRALGR